jgi:hypothetical protein
MPTLRSLSALVGIAVIALTGCASQQEWTTWKQHPSHFSSAEHLNFSVRNQDDGTPRR